MTPEKGYLGVIAEIKAGKGTVFDIVSAALARHGGRTQLINYSDPMGECLRGLTHITRNREAFQLISLTGREAFGQDVWAKEIDFRARQSDADFVVLAGMRRPAELPLVRALPNSYVLYLTAPAEKRWQWLRAKAERPGDADKTWEQFQIEDAAEAEELIRVVGQDADGHIDNNGTLAEFEQRVLQLLRDRFGIN